MDGDGKIDLVTADNPDTNPGTHAVSVWRNLDGRTFDRPSVIEIGPFPIDLVVRDFNGDGLPDVAVASMSHLSKSISILLNDGRGGLTAPRVHVVGELPTAFVAEDLDLDGIVDLAATVMNENAIAVLRGDGEGGFRVESDARTHDLARRGVIEDKANGPHARTIEARAADGRPQKGRLPPALRGAAEAASRPLQGALRPEGSPGQGPLRDAARR